MLASISSMVVAGALLEFTPCVPRRTHVDSELDEDGAGCHAADAELEDCSSGMLVKGGMTTVVGGGLKAGWPAITRC